MKYVKIKEVVMRCMGVCLSLVLSYLCFISDEDCYVVDGLLIFEFVRWVVDEWICLVNKYSVVSEFVNFCCVIVEVIVVFSLLD